MMLAHGEIWTVKELFVYPNEFIYWSVQIVMYPFMTGLVAGAFVLSSLYHVFGIKQLKDMARFALVFSFALLFVAPLPIMLHLQYPLRAINVLMTPHFTSAIAAFGIVFITYFAIVASELWFLYRKHFVDISWHSGKNRTRPSRKGSSIFFSTPSPSAHMISAKRRSTGTRRPSRSSRESAFPWRVFFTATRVSSSARSRQMRSG